MPHPARTRSFGRQMTRAEFTRAYRTELQEVRELQGRGVDTSNIEREINGAVGDFRAGRRVRDVGGLRTELQTDRFVPSSRG